MPELPSIPPGPHAGRIALVPPYAGRTPRGVRRGAWVGLAVCAFAAALALSVASARSAYFDADVRISQAVQHADLRAIAVPLAAFNAVGFVPLVVIAYGSVLLALFLAGLRWESASGLLGVGGAAGINHLAKVWVDRPRPSPHLVHVERLIRNPSFPAGHVLNFTVFAGFLCCLVVLRMRPSWRRNTFLVAMLAAIALMGLARIQSGEHWPSDVLGGYLLGAGWLCVTVLVYEWGRRRRFFARVRAETPRAGFGLVTALAILAPALCAQDASAAAEPDDSLAAATAVPWNPERPMARRQGWEQAVLLPGRVASLPLVGLGRGSEYLILQIERSSRLTTALSRPAPGTGNGIGLRTARLGDRTGLGGAVEAHAFVLHGARASRLSAEYSATLHQYGRTLLTWTGRPLALQFGEEWRPQERFYGLGNGTAEGDASDYAVSSEFVRGSIDWASNRERDPARARSALGLWAGPTSTVLRTGRESGPPSYDERFPAYAATSLDQRSDRLAWGARVAHDARTGAPHWSRGWRTMLSAEHAGAPVQTLALRSGADDGRSYTRWQGEAEAGASFMRDPRTVRLLVHVTDLQAPSNGARLLPSDLSTLGGHPGLGGFIPGRFHDMDMLLTRLDYVFPLERSFEMDLHSEWGGVYPDLWRDASLRSLHSSAGFSLRSRSARSPNAAIGFDFSSEGARLRFSLGGTE